MKMAKSKNSENSVETSENPGVALERTIPENAFQKRVFGLVGVKSKNSIYNADFTHQPRMMPDGTYYATDKVMKYSIRHYLKNTYGENEVFVFTKYNEKLQPMNLDEIYEKIPGKGGKGDKIAAMNALLNFTDIRLFGTTFAVKKINLSIQGPVQIGYGIECLKNGEILDDQIKSPYRNSSAKGADAEQTTLGRQSKLTEGHYIHNFSINPKNIHSTDVMNGLSSKIEGNYLRVEDINKLKEALTRGVSYYQSAAKIGTENEFMLWVQLKADSKKLLPVLTDLVTIEKVNESKTKVDMEKVGQVLNQYADAIETMEVYFEPEITEMHWGENKPQNLKISRLYY